VGVERIDIGPKGLSLAFRNNEFARPEQLVAWIAGKAGEVQLRADHRLVMQRAMPAAEGRPAVCKQIVQELITLAA
ncbi:MAG: hypothetical protein ACPG48_02215, partial [Candidatus Puniceispirillaceae bacterium]